jgi:acetolactate decarboxylase
MTETRLSLIGIACVACLLLGVAAGYLPGYYANQSHDDSLTQVSTIDALLNGLYDGVTPWGELKEYGDFGIGTFDGLDGEMIVLDDVCYQVKVDGVAYPVTDTMTIPFAAVTAFDVDRELPVSEGMNYTQLQAYLSDSIEERNIFYAVRIDGTFDYVKTRSVPGQEKPYPPLVDVTAKQAIFEFEDVRGTIVGFYSPDYVGGLNVPGYHLHFITDDKKAGGHVLELEIEDAQLSVDYTSDIRIILPNTEEFNSLDLAQNKGEELEKAEK